MTRELYLPTGDSHLNRILSIDHGEGGILCHVDERNRARGREEAASPVVLILGAAGTGKTTLALQIASHVAKGEDRCRVFLYSLEQPAVSLKLTLQDFAFGDDLLVDFAREDSPHLGAGKIYLCHFAPLPIAEEDTGRAFEDRFGQAVPPGCAGYGRSRRRTPSVPDRQPRCSGQFHAPPARHLPALRSLPLEGVSAHRHGGALRDSEFFDRDHCRLREVPRRHGH